MTKSTPNSTSNPPPTSSTPPPIINLKVEALGGFSAGIIGTVIGYPLDLVKTRMQTSTLIQQKQPTPTPKSPSTTKPPNFFQVGYQILRTEGLTSLYKGMTPPLISLSILNTITFTSYNYLRSEVYHAHRGFDIRNALAGMTCAPMCSSISTVEHFIKTQMQLDNIHLNRFTSSWHCMQTLVKEHGSSIRILYLGHGVNTLREAVFIGTYFYTYEGMRVKLDDWFGSSGGSNRYYYDDDDETSRNIDQKAPAWTIPFAGGLSGAWAWFVSFPLDCVKAGVQGQSLNDHTTNQQQSQRQRKKLKGMVTIFQELIREKGWRGLYAGVTPSIMRAFIVSSSRFTAYEMVVKLCENYLS